MLSITGMTLEQFSGLMQGLGYRAEKGERPKTRAEVQPVAEPAPEAADHDRPLTEEESVLAAETRAKWEAEQAARKAEEAVAEGEADDTAEEAAPPETETFYTFTWAPRPRGNRRPERNGERGGERPAGNGQQGRAQGERGPRREANAGGDAPQAKPRENRFDGKRRDENRGERQDRGPKGGKFRNDGPKGKPRHEGPKSFEARPPKADKKIDPDNPFAILASLKNKS